MISTFLLGLAMFISCLANTTAGTFDPSEWTRTKLPGSANLAAFGSGTFVMRVVEDQTFRTSTDGVNWSIVPVNAGPIFTVYHGGGRFIAGGGRSGGTETQPPSTIFGSSLDGMNWTFTTNSGSTAGPVQSIAFGNGRYIARTEGEHTVTSTNGIDWLDVGPDTVADDGLALLQFGNGIFVGLSGYVGQVFTSTDGRIWHGQPFSGLQHILFGNGVFVGWGSRNVKVFSHDAVSWSAINREETFLTAAFGNGRFFALTVPTPSMPGRLLSSYDGEHWQELSSAPVQGPVSNRLLAGNGKLVSAEYDSASSSYGIATSPAFTSLSGHIAENEASIRLFGPPRSTCTLNRSDANGRITKSSVTIDASGCLTLVPTNSQPVEILWISVP